MMDVSRFGMEYNPFLKNSRESLVETAQYREALFRLSYLEKTKGFGLLTGGPGRGKTTALRNWAASLDPSLYKVVYSCLSTLTVTDFYRSLTEALGGQPSFHKPDNFRSIQDEIRRLSVHEPLRQRLVMNFHFDKTIQSTPAQLICMGVFSFR